MTIKNKHISIGDFKVGNDLPFTLFAGPCQLESEDHAFFMVEKLMTICQKYKVNFVYKTSFDKANRSSLSGERGIGIEKAMPIFNKIKEKFSCPIVTDIHNEQQCEIIAPYVDILQIPAFLCRQTDLLIAAAKTNKVIKVKKGQFLAPQDMENVINKIIQSGNDKVLQTERGVCFGYNNLVSDMRSLVIMAKSGYPVIFDATHSTQQPGALGQASGGNRDFASILAKAALTTKIAGIFMETHQDPDNAPSDGPCMVKLADIDKIIYEFKEIDNLIKSF